VFSSDVTLVVKLTQAAYDALSPPEGRDQPQVSSKQQRPVVCAVSRLQAPRGQPLGGRGGYLRS
jgi:hypothetical protein